MSPGESDTEIILSQKSSQESSASPDLIKQVERILQKALKQTSEHIASNLTKEIKELGNCTTALEHRVDEIENSSQDFMTEL